MGAGVQRVHHHCHTSLAGMGPHGTAELSQMGVCMEREGLSCIWLVESAGKGSLSPTAVSGNLRSALQSPYLPHSPLCLVRDSLWGHATQPGLLVAHPGLRGPGTRGNNEQAVGAYTGYASF